MQRLRLITAVLAMGALVACGGPMSAGIGNMAPRARLAAPLSAPVNYLVTFDASTSFDPDGNVVEYTFSFSDGSQPVTQTTPTVSHAFPSAGAYEVAVVVRDDGGLLARATQLVIVRTDSPACSESTDCALGTECREHLCYATGASAATDVADCNVDSECGTGFTCRAGLCLSAQTSTH